MPSILSILHSASRNGRLAFMDETLWLGHYDEMPATCRHAIIIHQRRRRFALALLAHFDAGGALSCIK